MQKDLLFEQEQKERAALNELSVKTENEILAEKLRLAAEEKRVILADINEFRHLLKEKEVQCRQMEAQVERLLQWEAEKENADPSSTATSTNEEEEGDSDVFVRPEDDVTRDNVDGDGNPLSSTPHRRQTLRDVSASQTCEKPAYSNSLTPHPSSAFSPRQPKSSSLQQQLPQSTASPHRRASKSHHRHHRRGWSDEELATEISLLRRELIEAKNIHARENDLLREALRHEKRRYAEMLRQFGCCVTHGGSNNGSSNNTTGGEDSGIVAQWSGTTKNRDVSTGPLAYPFACSLALLTHSLACIEAADHPGHPHFHPLWFRLVKNQDISTWPLTCPCACSLTLLTHLLAPHCSLCLHTPLYSFVCLLVHFAHSQACGKVCNFVSKLLYFEP